MLQVKCVHCLYDSDVFRITVNILFKSILVKYSYHSGFDSQFRFERLSCDHQVGVRQYDSFIVLSQPTCFNLWPKTMLSPKVFSLASV